MNWMHWMQIAFSLTKNIYQSKKLYPCRSMFSQCTSHRNRYPNIRNSAADITKIPMAALKHLVNVVEEAVPESLSGLCSAYPQLEYHRPHRVVLSPDCWERKDKVAVICGGGSGHEPFAAGYVGSGMLTASIAGSIFAAPPSTHIMHAIQCVTKNNKAGVFVIIPNYTGDCLNFGIAIEKARLSGLKVKEIMFGDDCSIPITDQNITGKRGLTGMIVTIKIVGALAERGRPIEEISAVADEAMKSMATYAVGLSACSIPGQGLMFELAPDEIEYGMGIHGEAGYERKKLGKVADVVEFMLGSICSTLSIGKGDSVVAVMNNFGALSQLEQGIVVHEVVGQLKKLGIEPVRVYAGVLLTSLNSAGIHVTLLKLNEKNRSMFISCLDDKTNAPSWPGAVYSVPLAAARPPYKEDLKKSIDKIGPQLEKREQNLFKLCLQNACKAIIDKEAHLNKLDQGCGDGDCGSTLKRLADGILQAIDSLPLSHPSSVLSELGSIAEERMGGASGALYCLFLTTGGKEIASNDGKVKWPVVWSQVFRSGLDCMEKYGKAKPGDRTMLDALDAACSMYKSMVDAPPADIYDKIAAAAWKGCEATKDMKPRAGRASYVKQAQYLQEVDAGAYAAATWITAIVQTIRDFKG